jgi:TPR repeat protein
MRPSLAGIPLTIVALSTALLSPGCSNRSEPAPPSRLSPTSTELGEAGKGSRATEEGGQPGERGKETAASRTGADPKDPVSSRSAFQQGSSVPRLRPQPRYYRRVVALCIGINRYLHPAGIGELAFAEPDARAVGELLGRDYGFEPVYLLGPEATRRSIEARLEELGEGLGEGDALLVFFAGHGQVVELPSYGRAGFLVPYDAELDLEDRSDPGRWAEQALDMARLVERIEAMRAQHVLLLADACASGFMTRRGSLADRADLQLLMTGRSRAVIAAATERQAAREDRAAGHGYFTAALLDALRSRDAASLTDLFSAVRERVSARSNKLMLPQMAHVGEGDGEFVFIPQSITEEEVRYALAAARPGEGHVLAGVRERALQRVRQRTRLEDVIASFDATDYRHATDRVEKERVWTERFRRFLENAARGDPLAMAALQYCYAKGLGTDRDPAAAYRWARLAHEAGQPAGKDVLGRCLVGGIGVEKNEPAGEALLRAASDAGFPPSHIPVALQLGREGDGAGALRRLEEARAAGVLTASRYLGDLYFTGAPGVAANREKALEALRTAAEAGLPEAQFMMYELNARFLPEKDLAQAAAWLKRAAEAGDLDAQMTLARELLQLDGAVRRLDLPKDQAGALRWAGLAADQGSAAAHLLLCDIYERGYGAPVDAEKARVHCEAAARLNSPDAYFHIGIWWLSGRIYGATDVEKAAEAFRRAGDLGHATACWNLAQLYISGDLTTPHPRNAPEVLHWYTQAARHGHPRATENLPIAYREYLRGEKGAWEEFRRTYPASAKELVERLGLDPQEPWRGN